MARSQRKAVNEYVRHTVIEGLDISKEAHKSFKRIPSYMLDKKKK